MEKRRMSTEGERMVVMICDSEGTVIGRVEFGGGGGNVEDLLVLYEGSWMVMVSRVVFLEFEQSQSLGE